MYPELPGVTAKRGKALLLLPGRIPRKALTKCLYRMEEVMPVTGTLKEEIQRSWDSGKQ
jgi:hypothetical protein